jgi:DNA repair protein RecO (recombination protein O)
MAERSRDEGIDARAYPTMIIKTTGIVLRLDPFSKTSQVITWLTPDHGRIATLAKGAKRSKNNLVGQYDCFYSCELLFYQTRHSALHILKECSPLSARHGFRTDWRAALSASYICDLLARLTSPGAACPVLFDWADKTLDFLATQGTGDTVLNWAELKLLKLLGMAPKLSGCQVCGVRTWPEDRPALFSIPRGGLLCQTCKSSQDSLTLSLPHDVLAMLKGWESTSTPLMAKRTTRTPRQAHTASKLLGAFIHYHLESSRSREIALGLI